MQNNQDFLKKHVLKPNLDLFLSILDFLTVEPRFSVPFLALFVAITIQNNIIKTEHKLIDKYSYFYTFFNV